MSVQDTFVIYLRAEPGGHHRKGRSEVQKGVSDLDGAGGAGEAGLLRGGSRIGGPPSPLPHPDRCRGRLLLTVT